MASSELKKTYGSCYHSVMAYSNYKINRRRSPRGKPIGSSNAILNAKIDFAASASSGGASLALTLTGTEPCSSTLSFEKTIPCRCDRAGIAASMRNQRTFEIARWRLSSIG
jgi:hypothetical protein